MTKLYNSYSAQRANRYANYSNEESASSARKLASGKRITRAGDDAAGLSISGKMKSLIRSKQMATKNTNDAFSILETMQGVLHQMNEMVVRVRELSIQAASDTYSNTEREMIQTEVAEILNEMNRVANDSSYLNHDLLKGSNKRLDIQVDANGGSNSRISINLKEFAQTTYALGIKDIRVNSKHQAKMSLVKIDYAQGLLVESRSKLAATSKRLESTANKLSIDVENHEASKSRILDTDYGKETAKNVQNKILANARTAVMSQVSNHGNNYLKLLE